MDDKERLSVYDAICEYALNDKPPDENGVVGFAMSLIIPQIDANNKRFENGRMGGRPRTYQEPKHNQSITKPKPNDNQTITKQEPNHNQTETKQKPNNNQTITKQEPNQNQSITKEKPNHNQTVTKPKPNVNVNENVNVNDNDNENDLKESISKDMPKKRFVPPSKEEVAAYVAEKGYSVDAESFVDFYASKGWVVGKSPMKDWKAAVRNWQRTRREELAAKSSYRREDAAAKGKGFANYEQREIDYDSLLAGGNFS